MTVDPWTQALFASPPVLLGRRLRPFSLAHSLLLRALGSPYAYLDAPATARDLFVAADICARTCAENRAVLFGGGLCVSDLERWRWRWRRVDFAVADASFRSYLSDYSRTNPRHQSAGPADVRAPAGPVEYHLHRHLCEDRGWDDAAAWDCPLGYAWALLDIAQEWRAPGTLKSDREIRISNLLASESAARRAGNVDEADRIDAELRAYVAANPT